MSDKKQNTKGFKRESGNTSPLFLGKNYDKAGVTPLTWGSETKKKKSIKTK